MCPFFSYLNPAMGTGVVPAPASSHPVISLNGHLFYWLIKGLRAWKIFTVMSHLITVLQLNHYVLRPLILPLLLDFIFILTFVFDKSHWFSCWSYHSLLCSHYCHRYASYPLSSRYLSKNPVAAQLNSLFFLLFFNLASQNGIIKMLIVLDKSHDCKKNLR